MDSNNNVNINYIVKKLEKLKLIIAHPHHHNKRSLCYQISEEGIKYSEAYTNIRSKLIKEMFNEEDIEELIHITQALQTIRGFYIKSIDSFLYKK